MRGAGRFPCLVGLFLLLFPAYGHRIWAEPGSGGGALVISGVSWNIQGRVREAYVASTANFEIGRRFPDRAALDAYLADRLQRLFNLRLFDEASVDVGEGDGAPGAAARPVDLRVNLKESGTFVVLPGYSTNDQVGFLLKANVLLFDFEGTGGELNLGALRSWPPAGTASTSLGATLALPFYTGPVLWQSSVGLTPRLDDEARGSVGAAAALSATLPLLDRGGRGQLALVPALAAEGDAGMAEDLILLPSLRLQLGRVDWLGNRRRGFLWEIGASRSSEDRTGSLGTEVSTSYSADGTVHALIGSGAELMARAGGLWSPDGESGLGGSVRGIDAGRLTGDAGAYLNTDFWVNLGPFVFSKWLGLGWLSIFDVEVHAGPFVDLALPIRGVDPDISSGRIGLGFQIQSYSLNNKPFYLYTALGFDLRAALAAGSLLGNAADGFPIASLSSAVGVRY